MEHMQENGQGEGEKKGGEALIQTTSCTTLI